MRFSLLIAVLAVGGSTTSLAAQVTPDAVLVATRLSGSPATQLLEVDATTGAFAPLGRFPSDQLPPLAVIIDPINRDVVLAVDLGGTSRLLRLRMSGSSFVSESTIADVPGLCSQLAIAVAGDVYATIDGPSGGVVEIPRNGGPVATVLSMPYASAMATYSYPGAQVAFVAQSGSAVPPVADPQLTMIDLETSQTVQGPFVFAGYQPLRITGVVDLPTGVPRQLLSHDDGTISLYEWFGVPGVPRNVQLTPALPPGGTVAMHDHSYSLQPLVLGGSAHPYLKTFTAFPLGGPATWQIVAGPFPGDPVDFTRAGANGALVLTFGRACGTGQPMHIWYGMGGLPQLGNGSFSLTLSAGAANSPALLAVGFDDQTAAGRQLPLSLPNGCQLLVSPDHVFFHQTGASGNAEQPLPIPNNPALLGLIAYGQWFQAPALPFDTSAAAAVQIGA